MKIIIAGGTGFVGRHLCQELIQHQHEVIVLTRNRTKARESLPQDVKSEEWDCLKWEPWKKPSREPMLSLTSPEHPLPKADGQRHGRKSFAPAESTRPRSLVNAIATLPVTQRPQVLVNSSGIGYYGPSTPNAVDEMSKAGQGFLADLCIEWEAEALRAKDYGVRTVCVRTSMVLGQDGGALQKMLLPFQLFVGGPVGDGSQPVSWIHVQDLCRLIRTILENDAYTGPLNAASPHPVTMKEFCSQLGKAMGRPSWLPVPAFALKIALGEMSTLMTHGQLVNPLLAQKLGFTYEYPYLQSALTDILGTGST